MVYDIRHSVIPWICSGLLAVLSLATVFLSSAPLIPALLAGPLLALPLLSISFFSKGRLMGWGDGFFELSLGWLLGLSAGFTALILAVWTGALVGILLALVSQLSWKSRTSGFTMKSEIPFAPFLGFGCALVYFFHVDIFSTLSLFL